MAVLMLLPLLIFQPVSAAIAYRASGTGQNATGATTVVVTKPTGTVENDVMVAVIGVNQDAETVTLTAPSGWNVINANNSGTVLYSATYYKVATASEGSNYTFTINVSGTPTAKKAVGVISSYSGVSTSSPINISGSVVNASGTGLVAPSVTTTATNTMLVAAYSTATGTTISAGSSMTLRGQATSSGGGGAGTKVTSEMQDIVQAATGASGAKAAVAGAAAVNVGHTIALTPAAVVSQVGYKFFNNSTTSGSVGTAMAAQDTLATAPSVGQPFRLRMLLGVADAQLATSTAFKLQYKAISSGSCTSTGTFADVSSTTPIRWYDNGSTADAYTPLNSSGSDPVRSGISVTNQSYEEANNFTVSTAVNAGDDGMWDFALTIGSNVDPLSTYCLRAATSSGLPFTTYSQTPAIQPIVPAGLLKGQSNRWYQNADSTTPGTSLAAIDAAATLGTTGGSMRLRVGVNGSSFFKQISDFASSSHTCGIASDSLAYCWGDDASGQLGNGATTGTQVSPVAVDTTGVLSGKTILSISSGLTHTCVIASDNLAYCWGSDSSGQLGNGATTGTQVSPVAVDTTGVLSGKTILSIAVGGIHTCAIASDNLAYCWGSDSSGAVGNGATSGNQVSPVAVDTSGVLSGKTVLSIESGSHTCAIASDNLAYCWGGDTFGQLGNGATSGDQVSPVAVDTSGVLSGKTILGISASSQHTCAIASDNLAYCWGSDTNGKLGNGATSGNQVSPVAVDTSGLLSGKTVLNISAGGNHTCAIASDNLAYCWGGDADGELGNGATSGDQVSPVAVDTSGVLSGKTVFSITAGSSYTCAIASDYQAYCWGVDADGQLGNGATVGDQVSPVSLVTGGILSGKTILSIDLGSSHTCVKASDNNAYCWGNDATGQLGNGATSGDQVSPVAVNTSGVLSGKTISSISVGDFHTCAIASDNLAYCWGSDGTGQLGNGATSGNQVSPVAVDTSGVLSGKTILSMSGGSSHTCAIASDNLAYCWGDDTYGQLGNGATSGTQVSPVAVDTSGVLSGKTILSISTGGNHTCAIASDNLSYCWGTDGFGQLGNGATSGDQVSPVAVNTAGVLSGKTILSISAGSLHTCAIASDNLAYCWGYDFNGQLGNGATSTDQVSPVAVNTAGVLSGKTILSISASENHTCTLANDNNSYCWGGDGNGQLGNGATSGDQVSPVAIDTSGVLSGKTILSISAGTSFTCAIASDNLAYCWGDDTYGAIGNGAITGNQVSAVKVLSEILSPISLTANKLSLSLQFAQKTAGSCSAQTGFADVTGSTVIAYNNNATPANAAAITSNANDPIPTSSSTAQTYHEAVGTITNPNAINSDKIGLWDFSLIDNSAPASTTYCLRLAGADGSAFGSYVAFPEITTATPAGLTLNQMTRGGAGVLNGVKQNFSW